MVTDPHRSVGSHSQRQEGLFTTEVELFIRGGNGSNHYDVATGEEYWISGVKKDRHDRHWSGRGVVEIDDDARDEYERIVGGGSQSTN